MSGRSGQKWRFFFAELNGIAGHLHYRNAGDSIVGKLNFAVLPVHELSVLPVQGETPAGPNALQMLYGPQVLLPAGFQLHESGRDGTVPDTEGLQNAVPVPVGPEGRRSFSAQREQHLVGKIELVDEKPLLGALQRNHLRIRLDSYPKPFALVQKHVPYRRCGEGIGVESSFFFPDQKSEGVEKLDALVGIKLAEYLTQHLLVAVITADVSIAVRQIAAAIARRQNFPRRFVHFFENDDGGLRTVPCRRDGSGKAGRAAAQNSNFWHLVSLLLRKAEIGKSIVHLAEVDNGEQAGRGRSFRTASSSLKVPFSWPCGNKTPCSTAGQYPSA